MTDTSIADSGWDGGIDVDWGSSDHVTIHSSRLPQGTGTGDLTVTTAGGTSAPLAVGG